MNIDKIIEELIAVRNSSKKVSEIEYYSELEGIVVGGVDKVITRPGYEEDSVIIRIRG